MLKLLGGSGPPLVTLIGLAVFSVAYLRLVADERWAAASRPGLTLCFGLIHGFGFASVLMDLGLSPGRLAISILGFNLGVELGQIAVIGCLLLLGLPLRKLPPQWQGMVFDVLAAFLCGLGLFWFVGRSLAG